jgi:hypothetical protein
MRLIVLAVAVLCSCGDKPPPERAGPGTAEPVTIGGTVAQSQAAPLDSGVTESESDAGVRNVNKHVVGGNNDDPQMGLWAMTREAADKVNEARDTSLKRAYDLAEQLATKSWAGDRTFCEDAVNWATGWHMTSPAEWKGETYEEAKATYFAEILEIHDKMIGEDGTETCDESLRTYVEAFTFAHREKLELLNFGY